MTKGLRTPSARRSTRTTCRTRITRSSTRLRAPGAITIGKTNTPEFGRAPRPSTRSSARRAIPRISTRPAAVVRRRRVAVASGMLPFADGSDLAGACATPATSATSSASAPRPAACRLALRERWYTSGPRTDGAHRRRCALLSPPWRARIRARRCRSPSRAAFPSPRARFREGARRVEPRSGRPAHGSAGDRRPGAPAEVFGARLHRRGSRARFLRRDRVVRDPARLSFLLTTASLLQTPRRAQGHGDLEHRAGPRAHAGADRPRRTPAHGTVPPHAPLPRKVRVPARAGQPAAAVPVPRSSRPRSPA